MFFSVITKNLNWEILTNNSAILLLLEDEMGLRMKNFNMGGSLKNLIFRRGSRETDI